VTRAGDVPEGDVEVLLRKVMSDGKIVVGFYDIARLQARCREQVMLLPDGVRDLARPGDYPVSFSESIEALRREVFGDQGR